MGLLNMRDGHDILLAYSAVPVLLGLPETKLFNLLL